MHAALLATAAVAIASTLTAQQTGTVKPDATSGRAETAHLIAATSVRPASSPGKVTLVVDVTPRRGMHVYAPPQTEYIAVSLKLNPNPAVTAQAPRFPPGERFFFKPLDETQLVYTKPFRVLQDVTLRERPADRATLTIKGTLNYQACDDAICYMPVDVPLTWNVSTRAADR